MATSQIIKILNDSDIGKDEIISAIPDKLRTWLNDEWSSGHFTYNREVSDGKEIIIDRTWRDDRFSYYQENFSQQISESKNKLKEKGYSIEETIEIIGNPAGTF